MKTAVGKCQDIKNNALIVFSSDSDGHDCIQRIWSDNRIELIAQYDGFNFAFGKINHINVIGNLLYWTDGLELEMGLGYFNPPRKLNIVRASALTNQFTANKLDTWLVGAPYTVIPGDPKPKVEHLGYLYESIQTSTGQTPASSPTYWKQVRTKFVIGEIVGYQYDCYQCIQNSTVELPTDTAHWKLIEYKHYDAFTLENIMRGKKPPLQPTWSQFTDSAIKKNELRDKIFQFRTRFIYDDDEKSTWSCISTPTLLNLEYDGYYADPCINNTILLSIQTGAREVVRIQIACRINNGNWVLVDDLHKYTPSFGILIPSNSTSNYYFRNDIQTLPLDQIETNNLFSYVPQVSNCQELIQGNRLVDADITEGYDYPVVNCVLTPRYATVSQPTETSVSVSYVSTAYIFTMPTFGQLTKVSLLKFIVPQSATQKTTIQYFPKTETTIGQVLDNIVLEFAHNGVTAVKVGITLSVTLPNNGAALLSLINVPDRIGGLKYSSTQNPGIVFFDELKRSCSVYKLPKQDIHSVNDQVGGTTVSSLPVPVIDFTLSGVPPIQAYSYKFCHVDNRYAFLDLTVSSAYINEDSVKNLVRLNLDQAVLSYRTSKPNTVVEPWVWVKGDRLRILGYANYDSISYHVSEYDVDILGVELNPVSNVSEYLIPLQNLDFNQDWLVEIYRDVPLNIDPTVYFECGQEYLINYPRTSARAYGTTSGTVDNMYDVFQRTRSQKGAYAYIVNDAGNSFQIIDISIPTNPTIISTTVLTDGGKFVQVVGNYAYVLRNATLQIFDISNPYRPSSISSTDLDVPDGVSVRISGAYAYVICGSGTQKKLQTINIESPYSPIKYPSIGVVEWPNDIAIKGNYAYISGETYGEIGIVDISNPQLPVLLTWRVTGLAVPYKLFIQGNYLYVANQNGGNILIYDLGVPQVPTLVHTITCGNHPFSVFVNGGYIYVANHGANTLQIYNGSYSLISTTSVGGTEPWDLFVIGRYVYIVNHGDNTFSVIDAINPASPLPAVHIAVGSDPRSLYVTGSSSFNSIESRDYSDIFKSAQGDLGRVAVYSLELKRQRIGTLLRWSGVYLQNTNKNDLSFVDSFNYEQVNEVYGSVTKLFEYGDILNALQQEKVTSFYLGQAVLKQAAQSGVDIISTSTNVLGSRHQSVEKYGCQNPESFISIGSIFYYVDIINGCIVRNGSSESVPISDIGLKNYFKNLFSKIKGYYPKVVMGYDYSKNELFITIYAYIPNDIQKATLCFNDDEKAWKSYVDFVDANGNIPDCYGSIGLNMYAFNQGFWAHEKGTDYSKFFGVTVLPTFKIIGKGNGKSVFRSLSAISNIELKCDSILVFDNDTYLRQQSKLPKMVRKEKYWYAPFLRNQITNSPTPSDYDLYNGDVIRCDSAEITLQPLTSGLLQVFEVNVNTEPSL